MVDIPKPTLRHDNNIFNKVLTAWNKPSKTLVVLSYYEMIQRLGTKIRLMGSFNLIKSELENFDAEHEQTSYQKLRKRKYWFIRPKNIRS